MSQSKIYHSFCIPILCLEIAFLGLGMAGCRSDSTSRKTKEEHFPAHWPSDFIKASERLSLIVEQREAVETKASSIQQELADLVDWLPALVADSSLSKKEFDSVDRWAYPLASELKQLAKDRKSLDEMLTLTGLREGISMLSELAKQEQERKKRDDQETDRDSNLPVEPSVDYGSALSPESSNELRLNPNNPNADQSAATLSSEVKEKGEPR